MRHPLHPALVHFPIACWSLSTFSDVASLAWRAAPWQLAGMLMAVGTVVAVAAMAAGVLEFIRVQDSDPAMGDAQRHMIAAGATWSCYAASLVLRYRSGAFLPPDGVMIALSSAGFVGLCITGWLGGRLVYGHGVGTRQRDDQPPA